MFGFFNKKNDFDVHIETGMPLVEHFYKYGIYASNENLLQENKNTLIEAYEVFKDLKSSFNAYIVCAKPSRALTPPSERQKIVHYLMYATAFAYGLEQKNLDEKNLRNITSGACEKLFKDAENFLFETNGIYNNIFDIYRKIYLDINDDPLAKYFE